MVSIRNSNPSKIRGTFPYHPKCQNFPMRNANMQYHFMIYKCCAKQVTGARIKHEISPWSYNTWETAIPWRDNREELKVLCRQCDVELSGKWNEKSWLPMTCFKMQLFSYKKGSQMTQSTIILFRQWPLNNCAFMVIMVMIGIEMKF